MRKSRSRPAAQARCGSCPHRATCRLLLGALEPGAQVPDPVRGIRLNLG